MTSLRGKLRASDGGVGGGGGGGVSPSGLSCSLRITHLQNKEESLAAGTRGEHRGPECVTRNVPQPRARLSL